VRLATTIETKIAEHRSALADVTAQVAASRERVAAIERGEVVSGGLGKPLDIETVLKADGWTDADIQHCRDLVEVEAIARRFGGGNALAEKVDRAITEGTVAAAEAAQRKLVQRLLVELRALEPEPGGQD
jgi:hypothetical protein